MADFVRSVAYGSVATSSDLSNRPQRTSRCPFWGFRSLRASQRVWFTPLDFSPGLRDVRRGSVFLMAFPAGRAYFMVPLISFSFLPFFPFFYLLLSLALHFHFSLFSSFWIPPSLLGRELRRSSRQASRFVLFQVPGSSMHFIIIVHQASSSSIKRTMRRGAVISASIGLDTS